MRAQTFVTALMALGMEERNAQYPHGVMPWHATQRHTDRHDYRPTIDTTTVRHPSDPNHHTTTSGRGPDQDLYEGHLYLTIAYLSACT